MTLPTDPAREPAKIDRRILRTKEALRKALLELLNEKGYEAISVEEITQRANLGRATFYLHYKDKEDLLLEEFIEVAQDRVQVLSEIPLSALRAGESASAPSLDNQPSLPLLKIFEHAAEHASLYRVLLHSENSRRLADRIQKIVAQSINEIAQAKKPAAVAPLSIPIEMLAAYFSGALLNSLAWWLDEPAPPSALEMARMFQHLFFSGVWQAFGL